MRVLLNLRSILVSKVISKVEDPSDPAMRAPMYKSDKELLGEFYNLRSVLVSKVISKIEDPSAPAMRAPMYKSDKEFKKH